MTVRHAIFLTTVIVGAGCLAPDATTALTTEAAADAAAGSHAVVAIIDDGINPYHAAFRDNSPRAWTHPSTYLDGYPADAVRLDLSFDHGDLEDAFAADCETWESVKPGVLYWFPGTRIVGAIAPPDVWGGPEPRYRCTPGEFDHFPNILYGYGHGTMTASRAVGDAYGACPECLVVLVQGYGEASVAWAANQTWVDVQSNSWGPVLPLPLPDGAPYPVEILGSTPTFVRAVEDAAARQPAFWASGNGALTRFGVAGHPTQLQPHATPSAIMIGGHDSGRVAVWPGWGPHVVSDACWSWAAEHDDMDESTPRTGGGTSGATPFVAGQAARLVLEARRALDDSREGVHEGILAIGDGARFAAGPLADGELGVVELRRALMATADPRPDRTEEDGDVCSSAEDPLYAPYAPLPVDWAQVPEGPAGIALVGYGAVTTETAAAALAVLFGESPEPPRPDEDAWFERDARARRVVHDALSRD